MKMQLTQSRILLLLAIGMGPLAAQPTPPGLAKKYLNNGSVPGPFQPYLNAPGSRLKTPGKEQVLLTGSLNKGGINSTVSLIAEFPGKFRIDESGGKGRAIAFDGTQVHGKGAIDDDDEDLIESLGFDTVDRFLAEWSDGVGVRTLGHRFHVLSDSGFGSLVDIFETAPTIYGRRDQAVRVKHVMFDSQTGLLRRVAYTAREKGPGVRVETVYSDFTVVDGQQVPGTIRRLQNGQEIFSFTRGSASFGSSNGSSVKFDRP